MSGKETDDVSQSALGMLSGQSQGMSAKTTALTQHAASRKAKDNPEKQSDRLP